jgi:hypothetical protein
LCLLSARADETVTSTETIIRLKVHPMPAPKPALRYLLLPELKEMTPGNPIPNYLRALVTEYNDQSSDNPTVSRAALKLVDQAARMDRPDWQILQKAKTDGVNLLLPDVQKMRSLANSLRDRFREEVALRHFDDAIGTAKTMFAMARHMNEHPTLIADLVGIAMATVAIAPLEEMLEQPGCPNLCWALTSLPTPLVSIYKGVEGERILILADLYELNDKKPMSPEQINKAIGQVERLRKLEAGADRLHKSTRAWLEERVKNQEWMRAARGRLVESGISEKQVNEFPPLQVLLLDEKLAYEVLRDDITKRVNLPAWQFGSFAPQKKAAWEERLLVFLVPALYKVRLAQGRLEQRIALLRHVEALRMYAAEHAGQWPNKLSDVSVPLPVDPYTGNPFRYQVEGGMAHVRGSPPKGQENVPVYNLHYELTIAK